MPRLVLAALALVATLVASPSTAASTDLALVKKEALSGRLLELTLRTAALPEDTKVRVLLPTGYTGSTKRYPVLYLLNGGGGSWLDWTEHGNAEALTKSFPAIVVMPDGGQGGNYTDWFGTDGSGFRPKWETYHLTQLVPWVDRTFRTLPERSQRAVAGLSMGGNGALHYAARRPDLFVGAASFSGANDVFNPIIYPITEATEIANGATPGAVFGPRATEEVRWHASNPVDLAQNLRGTWVSLAFGNGQPGGPDGNQGVDVIETAVAQANEDLHAALVAAGVPHRYDAYGAGAHNWFYWSRELGDVLPQLTQLFAQHRPIPKVVSHSSIRPSYGVHGWEVRLDRPVLETSRLDASPGKLFLRGTGAARVFTPPQYTPGQRVRASITDVKGTRWVALVAGTDRRVRVPVDLGPASTTQQYSPAAQLTGTAVREARVTLS